MKNRRWYHYWPVLIALLSPLYSVEAIAIILLNIGVRRYSVMFPVLASVGMFSLIFWYNFIPWFWGEADTTKRLEDYIDKIFNNFQGRLGRILLRSGIKWIIKSFKKLNRDSEGNKEVFAKVEAGGRIVGRFFVFFAALNPIPFLSAAGWFPCIMVCGALKWKKGLFIMMLGDVIKNSVMSYLWISLGPKLWHFVWDYVF